MQENKSKYLLIKDVLIQNAFLSTDKTSSGVFLTFCGKTVALQHSAIIDHHVYM